jgi:SAM-dependent methyltransferase
MFPYAEPKLGVTLLEAEFYHLLDLPGIDQKHWHWDLRGHEASYLGNYDFAGKRVLEFGAASGGLTFWMEKQGAEVVAVDLSPDVSQTSWDLLPMPEDDLSEIYATMSDRTRLLNNGFWYGHEHMGSKAKLVHGTAYRVPHEIGKFDVVTLCAILPHLRDPIGAIENAVSFTDKNIIITELVPQLMTEAELKRPLAYFMPERSRRKPHGGWTWWHISPEIYRRYLDLKGFSVLSVTTRMYKHESRPEKVFTLVAERR